MGWCKGYDLMENAVIAVYNKGVLDKELLLDLVKPYMGTDLDCGHDLNDNVAANGKNLQEIIVEIVNRPAYDKAQNIKQGLIGYDQKKFKNVGEAYGEEIGIAWGEFRSKTMRCW